MLCADLGDVLRNPAFRLPAQYNRGKISAAAWSAGGDIFPLERIKRDDVSSSLALLCLHTGRSKDRQPSAGETEAAAGQPASFTTLSNGIRIPRLHLPAAPDSRSDSPALSGHGSQYFSDEDVEDEDEEDYASSSEAGGSPLRAQASKASWKSGKSGKTVIVHDISEHHAHHSQHRPDPHHNQHHHQKGYSQPSQNDVDSSTAKQRSDTQSTAGQHGHGGRLTQASPVRKPASSKKGTTAGSPAKSKAHLRVTAASRRSEPKSGASSQAASKAASMRDRPDFTVASQSELQQQWKSRQKSLAAQCRDLWKKEHK